MPDHHPDSGDAPALDGAPTIDVVICAYSTERLAHLRRAIESVVAQGGYVNVIVVIDHSAELLGELAGGPQLDPTVMLCENVFEKGLSGARNTGLSRATAAVVAFLDDDAQALPGWIAVMRRAYLDPDVIGTGGLVVPDWEASTGPGWFPDEFLWTVGCSYRGQPTRSGVEIRNPIGANMSFRRAEISAIGGFRAGLGRVDKTPLGCEETEAAIRMRTRTPWGRIIHLQDAVVRHYVPESRASWSYFRARCQAEGQSKALTAALVGADDGLSSERRYVLRTLPGGVFAGIAASARGDREGLRRSFAILLGVTLTAIGYVGNTRAARAQAADIQSTTDELDELDETPIAPIATVIVDLDLHDGAAELVIPPMLGRDDDDAVGTALVLVRWHGDPVAYLRCEAPGGHIDLRALRASPAVVAGCRTHVATFECDGREAGACPGRAAVDVTSVVRSAPLVTVAIPSIGRLDKLGETVARVRELRYPEFEILVVDNRPGVSETPAFVAALAARDPRVRCVAEPRPGSSASRNRALAEARGDIVCYLDDDVLVDPDWLSALVTPLLRDPTVGATTGLILPRALETRAQYLLEAYGGFSKGLRERRFDLASTDVDEIFCFPYCGGAFGTGASMGIRREAARGIGGFDLLMGTGSPGLAGDDGDILSRLVLAGYAVIYAPRAIGLHEHNRSDAAYRRQMFTYGVGLGAQLTKALASDRRFALTLSRSVARLAREAQAPDGSGGLADPEAPPIRRRPVITRVRDRVGVFAGPWYYAKAARLARREGLRGHLVQPPSRPRPDGK